MAGVSLSVVTSATANRGGVPAWTTTPTVRGVNEVDRKLSVRIESSYYTYTPTTDWTRPIRSWQWKRDGVAIAGATDPVYVTQAADLGKAITCTVTLTGENGSASATTGTTFTVYDYDPGDPQNTFAVDELTYSNTIQASTVTTTVSLDGLGLWKTSHTTGSITAGTTTLTVASASGFTIGDQIIIATGGEAGAGAYGTEGVGGAWPPLSYATVVAMNADNSKASGTLAWVKATGLVYQYDGAAWAALSSTLFYFGKAAPKALVTTITNISGSTITLDDAAVVSTTNANVYYDCYGKAGPYVDVNAGATVAPRKVTVGAGSFAFSGGDNLANGMKDFVFEGAGNSSTILFAPDGCFGISLQVSTVQRSIFRKFFLQGSHKLNSWPPPPDAVPWWGSDAVPRGLRGVYVSDILFDDINGADTMNECVTMSIGYDTWIRGCYVEMAVPIRSYIQWVFNVADSFWCGLIDNEVNSTYTIAGMELFGAWSCYNIRPITTNGYLSVNSGLDWYIDTPDVTFQADSVYGYTGSASVGDYWSAYGTILNLNTNISNQQGRGTSGADGGTVLYPRLVIEGMMTGDEKGRSSPIIVAPGYKNVMIRGGYPSNPSAGGYIEVPVQQSALFTCYGVACDADSVSVTGIRFVGFSVSQDYSVFARYASTYGDGRATNCVGENINARVDQRNQTNAQYIASGGV